MGGVGSGRKATSAKTKQIQDTLTEAGVYGAKIIRDQLRGTDSKHRKVQPVSMTRLKACVEAINHAIGLPKAKVYIKSDAMTMQEVAELAATFGLGDGDMPTIKLVPKGVKSGEN